MMAYYFDEGTDVPFGQRVDDDSAIVSPISAMITDFESYFSCEEKGSEKDHEVEQEKDIEEPQHGEFRRESASDVDGDLTIEEVDVSQTFFGAVEHPPSQFPAILAPPPDASLENQPEGSDFPVNYNSKIQKVLEVDLAYTLVHDKAVYCVRFSADGKYLATGGENGRVYVYDTNTGKEIW